MNSQYHAFLLRLQRSETADHWRITLENAHTDEKIHFGNEEELMQYLWQIVGEGRLFLTTPLAKLPTFPNSEPVP